MYNFHTGDIVLWGKHEFEFLAYIGNGMCILNPIQWKVSIKLKCELSAIRKKGL